MNDSQKKAVLLTGGRGFIGKNILERLGDKYVFLSPSHSELDLIDEKSVRKFFDGRNIYAVVHAASVGGNVKTKHFPDVVGYNMKMFENLAGCQDKFEKLIFLGSGAEYDKSRPLIRVSEEDFGMSVPTDDYGLFKFKCSTIIQSNPKFVDLRIFAVYGKFEDWEMRFISRSFLCALHNLPITIYQNVLFDFLYVEDLVAALDYFIGKDVPHRSYNICTGQPTDLVGLAREILSLTGSGSEIHIRRQGFGNEYSGDNSRLLSQIPAFKTTPMSDGLEKMHTWCRKIKETVPPEKLID